MDLVSAEVATALHAAGIGNLLLKGPTFARWLYEEGEPREYVDTDLLVRGGAVDLAEGVLSELGFEKLLDTADLPIHALHAHTWARRSDRAVVDLHWTLVGVETPAEDLWRELVCRTATEEVAGHVLPCMDTAARAFHVALHASHHGVRRPKPVEDLRRALERCDEATWAQAAALARRLESTSAFGTGLRMLPHGARLADRLGLPRNGSVMVALRAESSSEHVVMGVASLLEVRGARGKAKVLRRALWPSERYLRAAFPGARGGRAGLVLAHVRRPFWLLVRAPGAILEVRRARRAVRRGVEDVRRRGRARSDGHR